MSLKNSHSLASRKEYQFHSRIKKDAKRWASKINRHYAKLEIRKLLDE